MRALIACALLATLTLAAGCKPAAPETHKPRVALVMKSLANDFFATMADGARQYQAQHTADFELLVSGIRNETDLTEQVNLVEQAVAQGANAIVIAPADSRALVPALRRAQQQGVAIINIDNRLDPDAVREAGLKVSFVGPDNRDGARRVGAVLAQRLPAGAEVAIIEGVPTAFNGQQRRAGFEDAMQAAGMKVVAVQSGDWELEKANSVAANLLTAHPALKALLCANDNMALGAAAAVAAAGRTQQVLVAGFDAIGAIRPLLADGRVVATADQHAGQLAVFGIERASAALHGGPASADQTTPIDLVTR